MWRGRRSRTRRLRHFALRFAAFLFDAEERMRKNLALTLVLAAALAVGIVAIAPATNYVQVCLRSQPTASASNSCSSPLKVEFGGEVTPMDLPRHEMAPAAVRLFGKISTNDGTQPPAFREAKIDFDEDWAIDAVGLPVCRRSQLEALSTSAAQRVCHKSIVGAGIAHVAIESSDPGLLRLPLTLFNGGVRGETTTLFIRSSIAAPTPVPLIATVKLRQVRNGRYGLQAVSKIPQIADGSGSLIDFSFKVKRLFKYEHKSHSYVMAKCPDGDLGTEISSVLKNEAKTPGLATTSLIKGSLTQPCKPKR